MQKNQKNEIYEKKREKREKKIKSKIGVIKIDVVLRNSIIKIEQL